MTRNITLIALLSLGLGATGALAQTSPAPATPAPGADATIGTVTTLPQGWEGAIGDTFFDDTATGSLRSEADISTSWRALSAEDQATVREYCVRFEAEHGTEAGMTGTGVTGTGDTTVGTGGAAATGGSTAGTDATGAPATGTDSSGAATTMPGTAGGEVGYQASIAQICSNLDTM